MRRMIILEDPYGLIPKHCALEGAMSFDRSKSVNLQSRLEEAVMSNVHTQHYT